MANHSHTYSGEASYIESEASIELRGQHTHSFGGYSALPYVYKSGYALDHTREEEFAGGASNVTETNMTLTTSVKSIPDHYHEMSGTTSETFNNTDRTIRNIPFLSPDEFPESIGLFFVVYA